jgi:hypothetical protein
MRQEHFALQLITLFDQIFKKAELPLKIRPYHVLATGVSFFLQVLAKKKSPRKSRTPRQNPSLSRARNRC